MTTLTYTRNGTEFAVEAESLPPTAVQYLLQYGWAQSLQDSIAGRAKAVRDELIESGAKAVPPTVPTEDEIESAVVADIAGQLAKRSDAIKAGTVGTRSGEPRDPFKALCRRIAVEMLKAHAKAKGMKLPKADSDEYEALVGKVLTQKGDAIEKEAKRRQKLDASADIDLG